MVFCCFFLKNFVILAVILNYFINYLNIFIMDSPANFSTTMLYIGAVSAVVFVVLFIFCLTSVSRIRKAARQLLEKGFAFEEDVNTEKIKLFYCYRGKFVTVDCDGDDVRAPYFVNECGIEVDIFPDIRREVFVGGLMPDSMIPSKAYRLAIDKTCLKHNDDGTTYNPQTLQVFFRPAKNDVSQWTVAKVEKSDLILEHPLMGKLRVPKRFKKNAEIGQNITLISKVTEFAQSYRLEYETA